jgi:hypothetical protein
MKFSQILAGVRAEQPASFQVGTGEDGKPILASVVLRPLSMMEEMDVEADAISDCKAKGAEASPRNPVYESARILAVLSRSVLDPDSPKDKREPFFDLGSSQAGSLDPDTLANLHAMQEAWQEECSPSYRHKSPAELMLLVKEMADNDADPFRFARYSRKTQWSLALFMARMLVLSPAFSSWPGSSSERSPTSDASDPSSPKSPGDMSNSPTGESSPEDSSSSDEDEEQP